MQKAEILIVTDPDKVYGINKGYYPDLEKSRRNGNLEVVSISKDIATEKCLSCKPAGDGKDVYIFNHYSGQYVSYNSEDILNVFAKSQTNAIREALVKLGAKIIRITEEVEDIDKTKQDLEADASKGPAEANMVAGHKRILSLNIKSIIKSEDVNREAKPASDVREYMEKHGLMHDDELRSFLERLESDGELHGKEMYHVILLSSLSNSLKIGASINVKGVFGGKIDFSAEHNHIHKVEKKLLVYFDYPSEEELERIRKEDEADRQKFCLDGSKE